MDPWLDLRKVPRGVSVNGYQLKSICCLWGVISLPRSPCCCNCSLAWVESSPIVIIINCKCVSERASERARDVLLYPDAQVNEQSQKCWHSGKQELAHKGTSISTLPPCGLTLYVTPRLLLSWELRVHSLDPQGILFTPSPCRYHAPMR